MEFLLTNLPTIFCYLSGILIAWSGFILFNFAHILQHAKKCGRNFRKGDIIQTGVIGLIGIALTVALFVLPQQAAQVMDLLLVLDCWYLAFLISVTGTSTKSLSPRYSARSRYARRIDSTTICCYQLYILMLNIIIVLKLKI